MRSPTMPILLALTLSVAACGGFGDMIALQRGLAHEFGTDAIGINVSNNSVLTVTFANTPAATLPDSDRAAFARRVAEYVRDHYPEYPTLAEINVGFSQVHSAGIVTVTNTNVPYTFPTKALGAPHDTTHAGAARKAAA